MIKIRDKKPVGNRRAYYSLTYNYMIGDANGDTSETLDVLKDNPFIERYVTLLRKLQPLKGHWGIVFDHFDFNKYVSEGQLTQEEHDFLVALMFEDEPEEESTFKPSPEDLEYTHEFYEGVMGETEYSFLVFQGVELVYVDENGIEFDTYFED